MPQPASTLRAGDRAVELMKASVARTAGPEVVGGIGGFAGLFDATRLTGMRRPLLATSTDGVGTKVVIARRMSSYDTIGLDLVGMVVDDLVVCGAEPLFMTDYMVCGRVQPERVARIVTGIAEGCVQAGCALVGGETAEHLAISAPTSSTSRAPPPAWLRRTGCSALTGSGRGRRHRDGLLRAALQRLLPGPEHHR